MPRQINRLLFPQQRQLIDWRKFGGVEGKNGPCHSVSGADGNRHQIRTLLSSQRSRCKELIGKSGRKEYVTALCHCRHALLLLLFVSQLSLTSFSVFVLTLPKYAIITPVNNDIVSTASTKCSDSHHLVGIANPLSRNEGLYPVIPTIDRAEGRIEGKVQWQRQHRSFPYPTSKSPLSLDESPVKQRAHSVLTKATLGSIVVQTALVANILDILLPYKYRKYGSPGLSRSPEDAFSRLGQTPVHTRV